MNKTLVNFWLDLVMLVNFLALAGTGAILKWALPRGRNNEKYFWDLHRHDWQDWHFYLSVLLFALILAHLVLHWNWLACQLKMRFFGGPKDPSCPD